MSTISRRSTGFGFGSKIFAGKKNQSPSPNSYKIPSQFEQKNKGNVFSFRCSWKSYSKVYQKEGFINTLESDVNLPGPGSYK